MEKKLIYLITFFELLGLLLFSLSFKGGGSLLFILLTVVVTVLVIRDKHAANKNGFADSNLKVRLFRVYLRDSLLLFMGIMASTSDFANKSPVLQVITTIFSGLLGYWVTKNMYRIYHDDFLNFRDHFSGGNIKEPKGKIQINYENVSSGKTANLHKLIFDDGSFVLVDKNYKILDHKN